MPTTRRGWQLMFLFMWDAIFHRKPRSSEAYAKWDQDSSPSYPPPPKRKDQ
jgi:hypothetical protein